MYIFFLQKVKYFSFGIRLKKKLEFLQLNYWDSIYFRFITLMYVPLHWHSTFSFLEALWHPKHIVAQAKNLWYDAIAITDYNWMFGMPAFFQASKDSKNPEDENDTWVKSIFGTELSFVMDLNASLVWKSVWNICLLAQNDKWYNNMMELVTFANQSWLSNGTAKIDLNILKEKSDWIIIFSWGEQSWISKMQSSWESEEKIEEVYNMLHEIFTDRCYLEITAQDESVLPITKKVNQFIYQLAKKTNTNLIVNNDYRYVKSEDKQTWEIALSIKDWTKMYDANRRKPDGKYHIMTEKEIKEICLKNGYSESEIDERMTNNVNIANQIDAKILLNQKLFPKYEIPEEMRELYDKYGESSIINE